MTKFERRFYRQLLIEQDDRDAFEATLDRNTDPADFDVDNTPANPGDPNVKISQAMSERGEAMKQQLGEWVSKMDEFLDYLNGPTEGSIQYTLSNAESDTIFDKMKASEQRKITRVATELASLCESFKGYLSQTSNVQFKYV